MNYSALELGRLAPPVWATLDLQRIESLFASGIQRAIRNDALGVLVPPDWRLGIRALNVVSGPLDNESQSLATRFSYFGFRPTEPQVTQGWAHFLSPSNVGIESASQRFEAFYQALHLSSGRQAPPLPVKFGSLKVKAEHAAHLAGRRLFIDLLFTWQDLEERPRAIAVELKFGHQITDGQLSSYRQHIARKVIRGDATGSDFFVVAARSRRSDSRSLKRNKHWSRVYWPAFLRAFEKVYLSKSPQPDADFEQFRRTVWERKNEV